MTYPQQHYPVSAVPDQPRGPRPFGRRERRALLRIEIVAWLGFITAFLTLAIVVYWSVTVYESIHSISKAVHGG